MKMSNLTTTTKLTKKSNLMKKSNLTKMSNLRKISKLRKSQFLIYPPPPPPPPILWIWYLIFAGPKRNFEKPKGNRLDN